METGECCPCVGVWPRQLTRFQQVVAGIIMLVYLRCHSEHCPCFTMRCRLLGDLPGSCHTICGVRLVCFASWCLFPCLSFCSDNDDLLQLKELALSDSSRNLKLLECLKQVKRT